jgi:hypothetical protein
MAWKVRGSNPSRGKRFFSSPNVETEQLWNPPGLLFTDYWRSLVGIKRPAREVSHSPPSSGEVKKEWSCMLS